MHKARVEGVLETENGMEVALFDRGNMTLSKLPVGFVVNCTGPECNYYKLKEPLVLNLIARGLIHPDPLFLGLMAAPNGALLNYLGQPSANLFTLGSVKKGVPMSQTSPTPTGRLTVVLVHGAYADASSWNGVIQRLQARGVQVTAPARLPGLGCGTPAR